MADKTTYAPHIRNAVTVDKMMLELLAAASVLLIPALFLYGLRPLTLVFMAVAGSVLPEALLCLIKREKQTLSDFSAIYYGVVITLLMPPGVPIWLPFVASAFGSAIAKLPFGRLGRSVFSPAAAGFVFVSLAWGEHFVNYPALNEKIPFLANWELSESAVFFEHQTPIQLLNAAQIPFPNNSEALESIFGFNTIGPIGAAAPIVVIVVISFLIFRNLSAWQATVSFCVTVFLIAIIFRYEGVSVLMSPIYELFCNWMFITAVFLAGDIITAPRFASARVIYGVCCGVLAVLLRRISVCQGGEIAAVLIMNAVSPSIDRLAWNARQKGISITAFRLKIKHGFEKRMKQFED